MAILLNSGGTWRSAGPGRGLMRLWSRQPLQRDPYDLGRYAIWVRARTIWRREGGVWTPHSGGAGADMGSPVLTTQRERVDPDRTIIRDPQNKDPIDPYYTRLTVPWGSAECIAVWVRDGTAGAGYTGWIYHGCYDNPHDGTPLELAYGPASYTNMSVSTVINAVWFALTAFPEPAYGMAFPRSAQGFTRFAPGGVDDSDQYAYV